MRAGDRASATTVVAALLAVVAICFALVVVHAPELLPPTLARRIDALLADLDPRTAMLAVGAVAALFGLFSLWVWRARPRSEPFAAVAPEEPERETEVAGEELTRVFERRAGDADREFALEEDEVPTALREVLVAVYAPELGDREDARRHVETGRWTEDRYAAAFVATSEAVDYPLRHRLYAWLYPGNAYERRARRALRAVEEACERRLSGYEAPERSTGWLDRLRAAFWPGGEGT